MNRNSFGARGFTIVELLIVIVVIGILAGITIVAYSGISAKSADASMKADLENSAKLLQIDYVNNSTYPTSTGAANGGKGLPTSNGSTYSYTYDNNATPATYSLTISSSKSSNRYNITNTNNVPTLVVGSPPVITNPTVSSVTNSDGCGSGYYYFGLYSTATGSPTPTVQWQRLSTKNTTTGTWIDISGATTSYYNFNTNGILTEPDFMVFRAVWTSGSYTATSPTMQIALTNGC